MKTFREFILEGRSREEAEKERQSQKNPNDWYLNNAGSSANPNWRLKSKVQGQEEKERRQARIAALSSEEEKQAAERKKRLIQKRGYEAHHITSTKESERLRSTMSDEEWAKRVERDRRLGIFHGHQPRNIMAAKKSSDPEDKPGIYHRKGGAHSIEGKTKDIRSGPGSVESAVTNRDLVAAALRKRSREKRKQNAAETSAENQVEN